MMRTSTKLLGALCLALALLTAAPDAPAQDDRDMRRTPTVRVVERTSPSVVSIQTQRIVRRRYMPWDDIFDFGDRNTGRGNGGNASLRNASLGSGVIIDSKGFVVTNDHVISRADKIIVADAEGKKFQADLIGSDSNHDIAILKIRGGGPFPAARLGDSSDVYLGERTIAMGNPFGLSGSVTTGILSATRRSVNFRGKEVFSDFLQTSAVINPGNSGGPLLNILGEVIGINVAIHSRGPGIGFAIPVNRVREVLYRLLDPQLTKKAWLGVEVDHLDERSGAAIAHVDDGGPAARGGLAAGDVVVQVNDETIENWIDFRTTINRYKVGEPIKLTVDRAGSRVVKAMRLEVPPPTPEEQSLFTAVGFRFDELPRSLKARSGSGITGIYVTKVTAASSAAEIGLEAGDIITHFGRYPIRNMDEAKRILHAFQRRQSSLPLTIVRGGVRMQGAIALE